MTNRIYPGTEVTITTSVTNQAGVLTDPDTITFFWKVFDNGEETEVTPVNSSTGIYTATFTPLKGGNVWYRWRATNPSKAEDDWFPVSLSKFEDFQ